MKLLWFFFDCKTINFLATFFWKLCSCKLVRIMHKRLIKVFQQLLLNVKILLQLLQWALAKSF